MIGLGSDKNCLPVREGGGEGEEGEGENTRDRSVLDGSDNHPTVITNEPKESET